MPYEVYDMNERPHRFRTLPSALRFAYSQLTAYMKKRPNELLKIRTIWGKYGNDPIIHHSVYTEAYVGRIRYGGLLFTYYRNKKEAIYKLSRSGKLSKLTDREKKIICKVENPEDW